MDGAVADETIERMLAVVDETWDLRAVSAPEYGTCSVYHVDVETSSGPRECVLKAAPGDGEWGISTEARVLSLLGARTGIPVPEVLGVVDEHREFPSPFFVMDRLPGSEVPYRQVGRLSDAVAERLRAGTRRVCVSLLSRSPLGLPPGLPSADHRPCAGDSIMDNSYVFSPSIW
jgi:hypothetical protein